MSMTLESLRADASSRSLHDPSSVSNSPFVEKHTQQQSAELRGQTFVSSTVVPTPDSTEILSSLISSLTVLSDSAREQLRNVKAVETSYQVASPRAPRDDPFLTSGWGTQAQAHTTTTGAYSDEETAQPPVAGYVSGRSRTSKTSARERWAIHKSDRAVELTLKRPKSNQTLRAFDSNTGVGVPSIERPATSGSLFATRSSSRAASIQPTGTSRPQTKTSLRMFRPSRSGDTSGQYTNSPGRIGSQSMEVKQPTKSLPRSTMTKGEDSMHEERVLFDSAEHKSKPRLYDSSSSERQVYNPLSPSHRDDLGDHLIPSRKSSLRHSPGKSSSHGQVSLKSRRPSTPEPDTRPSMIENEDTDEDSTVRRIKELQRAREQRQSEWLNESRSSDRTKKRAAVHDPAHRRGSSTRGQGQPKHDALLETPESEESPELPVATNRNEISKMGTPTEKEPMSSLVTPISLTPAMPSLSRNSSTARPVQQAVASISTSHKRTLSGGLRRSTSVKKRTSEDMKSVSESVEAFLTAPRLTQRIRHPRSGRTIAFSEVGDPDGFVVFVCVGMGLTRYVTSFYDDVARTQKLRLITIDRPGIGESSAFPDDVNTPLAWVDDLTVICHNLNIQKFSLLAHSAGSIYALATALKMPTYVRGRIHLLAPWIPPSQMITGGKGETKMASLPTSHKILSMLPAPFLKAANSRFLSATSASIDSRNGSRKKDRGSSPTYDNLAADMTRDLHTPDITLGRTSSGLVDSTRLNSISSQLRSPPPSPSPATLPRQSMSASRKLTSPFSTDNNTPTLSPAARAALYNQTLTHRTWSLSTAHANPATDLIVCLERRRTIGFFYRDVTRSVVIHHGRLDSRVPLENVQWLESTMKRCELRILDGEGHGLMASAAVMSSVLSEVGREWEEWEVIAKDKERRRGIKEREREGRKKEDRERFIRTGRY